MMSCGSFGADLRHHAPVFKTVGASVPQCCARIPVYRADAILS
jgi:hypothetical protein